MQTSDILACMDHTSPGAIRRLPLAARSILNWRSTSYSELTHRRQGRIKPTRAFSTQCWMTQKGCNQKSVPPTGLNWTSISMPFDRLNDGSLSTPLGAEASTMETRLLEGK